MYLQKVMSKKTLKHKIIFCCRLEGQDQEPDSIPLVRRTDPRFRIRTKMSRIRNAAQSVERARQDSDNNKSAGKIINDRDKQKLSSRI
jgi:hypothetical protein